MFGLKHFMFESELDMNQSLQVETGIIHDRSAVSLDLQKPDHVKTIATLAIFSLQLPSICRILPSFVDDHVKLRPKLPCSEAITSKFG